MLQPLFTLPPAHPSSLSFSKDLDSAGVINHHGGPAKRLPKCHSTFDLLSAGSAYGHVNEDGWRAGAGDVELIIVRRRLINSDGERCADVRTEAGAIKACLF